MNNIDKIDKLLKDDISLETYISKIEKDSKDISKDLQQKILSKINKKKKNKYADICKIVACLIFSLAVCRTDFIINDDINIYKEDKQETKVTTKINEKLSDFCKWVTTPIEKEEEEI